MSAGVVSAVTDGEQRLLFVSARSQLLHSFGDRIIERRLTSRGYSRNCPRQLNGVADKAGRVRQSQPHVLVKVDHKHLVIRIAGEDDVEIDLRIAPWEAALGAKVRAPTLDGPVEMTIRAGTPGGQKLRLRGEGLNRRGDGRGDQYVKIRIVIPPKLTKRGNFLRRWRPNHASMPTI
jgi:DnaJ-class molecular chaperone